MKPTADLEPQPKKESRAARGLRDLLTLSGVAVFVYLIHRMGWGTILGNVTRFGGWFVVVLLIQLIWLVLQAAAWSIVQNSLHRRAPLLFFVRIKIVADTMNTVLPTANLGGDAMRAYLVKPYIPLKEGIAGVLVDKTFEFAAGMLFMAIGVLAAFSLFHVPTALLVPAIVCLLVLVVGMSLLVVFQFRGFFESLLRAFGWIPGVRRVLIRHEEELQLLDKNLRIFYTCGVSRILQVAGLHILARLVGVLEVLVALWALNVPVTYFGALFITASVTIANTIFFVVPGEWGVQEGMHVLALKSLHFSASVGLSLGVIRRVRRLLFLGIGLVLYNLEKQIRPGPRRRSRRKRGKKRQMEARFPDADGGASFTLPAEEE
jgi:uncharacterized membrane protein YbhN (UPF0104 family)